MANTQKYLNHLLQNTGITPACSEEEHEAAQLIEGIFTRHGFQVEVQEFNASSSDKVLQAVLGILVFLGAALLGAGGIILAVCLLVLIACAVVYTVERMGKPIFSQLGAGRLSQNVIAYHKASGPLASPRNRPVVVVAHYDSPRADLLCQEPFSKYRPFLVKALPVCMVAPAVIGIVRLLPFPSGVKAFLWLLAVIVALVPLASAAAIIANKLVLPYTTGSVCNKSSVAAMLGVMDEVAPFEGREEFPDDVPFDEYFSEQVRMAEEAAAAIEAERLAREEARRARRGGTADGGSDLEPADGEFAVDDGATAEFPEVDGDGSLVDDPFAADDELDEPFDDGVDAEAEAVELGVDEVGAAGETAQIPVADETAVMDGASVDGEPEVAAPDYPLVNAAGNLRFGPEIVASLGMLAESCTVVYETESEEPAEDEAADALPVQDAAAVEDAGDQAGDEPDLWEEGSEPLETIGYDDAPEFYHEPEPSVGERIRDGASRLISFVRSKAEQVAENIGERDAEEPVEEPAEELESEPESEPELEFEGLASATDIPFVDETGSTPSLEVEEEPEVERTVERTATIESAADEKATAQVSVAASEPADGAAAPAASMAAAASARAVPPTDTADALMAEIYAASGPAPSRAVAPRVLNVPSTTDVPGSRPASAASRASLFDLPDPSAEPVDPFASPSEGQQSGSASTSWKGGAASAKDLSEEELREAITSMGDDELLGHDIWFVATGASECGNAGIEAFLDEHRAKLRGVFVINLECVGAGQLAVVATEGRERVLKGDRRIMSLVTRVASDFHHEFETVEMPYLSTDAYVSMNRSLRSLTIGGVEEHGFALSHSEDDQPYNVDASNVAVVADVVTEVIRRS